MMIQLVYVNTGDSCEILERQGNGLEMTPEELLMLKWKKCKNDNNGKLAEELLPATKDEGEYGSLFKLFAMTLCAPNVVGQTVWRKRKSHELYSEIVTMADESFALLVLENNFDTWLNKVKKVESVLVNGTNDDEDEVGINMQDQQKDNDESTDVSGLTSASQGSSSKTNTEELAKENRYTKSKGNGVGWSEEGLRRFGEIMKVVIKSRRNSNINGRREWEEKEKDNFLHVGRIVPLGNGVGTGICDEDNELREDTEKETASSALLVAYEFEKTSV